MGHLIDPGTLCRHLECPGCHKAMRWSGDSSGRLRCPYCRTRFIVLLRRNGTCIARPESDETVDELILDWLRPQIEEDDDEERPTPPQDSPEHRSVAALKSRRNSRAVRPWSRTGIASLR
ncbi:MAG: hypothetical protein JSU68_02020 [Phycisphaerales bacterium]|nr:MAG: hypothetical protein JSU68_02020 [Phycisphaerales bacterium]